MIFLIVVMYGLLRIIFEDLFWLRLPKPPAKKEIREQAAGPNPDSVEEDPKPVEQNIVSSAKPIRPVSSNIDIPKVRDDIPVKKESPKLLMELDMRAMRCKNKSRRRAYEKLHQQQFQLSMEPFRKQNEPPERSDSPELIFQMDDIA